MRQLLTYKFVERLVEPSQIHYLRSYLLGIILSLHQLLRYRDLTSIVQLYPATMSEGKECRDKTSTANGGEVEGRIAVPPMVNEDKGEVAVSPMVNEGEGKAVTTPIVDEGQGMDRISPVMSYEPGTDDYLEPFTSEGETRYEGKGKNRGILGQSNICDSTS